MPTYAETKAGYTNLWNQAQVRPQFVNAARNWAVQISDPVNATQFKAVEAQTGVPWFFIGLLLMRESSLNLHTYLGNGQPLSQVTTVAPVGRGPFPSFLAGAVDALKYQGYVGITQWPVSHILWLAEKFNGWGYYNLGVNSPYLWSWTTLYTSGKYVSDGVYSSTTVDPQPGIAAVLKELIVVNTEVATYLAAQETPMAGSSPVPSPSASVPVAPPAAPKAVDPIPQIEAILNTIQGFLPMVAPFLGPYGAAASAAIPLIEDLLNTIEQLKSGQNILQVLAGGLHTAGTHLQTISATLPKA